MGLSLAWTLPPHWIGRSDGGYGDIRPQMALAAAQSRSNAPQGRDEE